MANRLTKIYTRTGDDGTTGMADGSRVAKDDLLVCTIGDVDELNSQLALVACQAPDDFLKSIRRSRMNCLMWAQSCPWGRL